ncbi:MAG TPA: GAF domain-containing SpoIIE family protein phosphatase [Gemmatimonadales bacterium]|nr:GAF domain-containing SpoIIE family protein phosphatase [Gemmatimonadales bacterium]
MRHWIELSGASALESGTTIEWIIPVVTEVMGRSREATRLAEELQDRSAEIELLCVISEILGQARQPRETAGILLRELSDRLQARRASLMLYDPEMESLRTYAARGYGADAFDPVSTADADSISARVFRERRSIAYDPVADGDQNPGAPEGRTYVGRAFLSAPINYAAPGAPSRCVGVINFTDRIGNDAFTAAERRLVGAVASQIGAAIENARLVARDRQREQLSHELELAHDLQLKLLPSPAVLQGDAKVAARCRPVESVGGDFYTFVRLGQGRVGVMLGDVSSHGYSAALVMALVISAAGIHAAASRSPDETLIALLESLGPELLRTEMYFSAFYGTFDPGHGRLDYASAGHPYAWRVASDGSVERLEATSPPLGLGAGATARMKTVQWAKDDLLVLWTDGLVDARNEAGEKWGEQRLLDVVVAHRKEPVDGVVTAAFEVADSWSRVPDDDRTLLVMRL